MTRLFREVQQQVNLCVCVYVLPQSPVQPELNGLLRPTTSSTPSGSALSAAVSSSLSQNIAEVVGQGGAAPLTSLQIHFIQNMIHETLEEFRFVPPGQSDKHCCERRVVMVMFVSPLKGHLPQRHRQPASGDGPAVLHPAGENLCFSTSVVIFYLSEDTTECGCDVSE